jgi:hypothetical protein
LSLIDDKIDQEASMLSSKEHTKKHVGSGVDSSPGTSFGRKSSAIDNGHSPLNNESKLKTATDAASRKGKERETEPSSSKRMEFKSSDNFEGVREISKPGSKSSPPKRKSQVEEHLGSPSTKRSKKSNMTKIPERETVAAKENESSSPSFEKRKGKKVGTFKSSVSLVSSSLVSSNLDMLMKLARG